MSTEGWLGPGVPWPAHGRGAQGIRALRASGWWLKPSTGGSKRIYGLVQCKPPDGSLRGERDDLCEETIYQTAGQRSAANHFMEQLVRDCPHRESEDEPPAALQVQGSMPEARSEAVHWHLDQVERLCDAIELLQAQDEAETAALGLLEEAEAARAASDDALADALEAQAETLSEQEREHGQDARAAASDAEMGSPWPPAHGQLIAGAEGYLHAVGNMVDEDVDPVTGAVDRYRRVSKRVARLREERS